jgi:hypothetical protein
MPDGTTLWDRGGESMNRKIDVTGGFRLSQDFGDRRKLRRVGPAIKAQWRVPEEAATRLRSMKKPVPNPVEGYMIIHTGFEGIAIDDGIAKVLGLGVVSKADVHGVEGVSPQDTCMALLLVPVVSSGDEKIAIGINIEAVAIPNLTASYATYGLLSPEGEPVRIIGVLGRQFLQFTTFTYKGLDGSWEMLIDESIMRPHDPNAPETKSGQQQSPGENGPPPSPRPVFFKAERILIAVESRSKLYKVMQIHFGKKDGSLYVSFPYYKHRDGLVSLVKCPPNMEQPADVEMNPGGKATTHLVKYSHHPDGRAHFSQDGRVRTIVQKQSVPLAQTNGHIFTVKIQGITEFEEGRRDDESRPVTMKRKSVYFNFGKIHPEAIKIVGRWYTKADFMKRLVRPAPAPFFTFTTEKGITSKGVLLASPFPVRGEECVMALTCEALPPLDKQRPTSITFLGGFDRPGVIDDVTKETSFLSFTYPVTDIEGLEREIGSIDFKRDAEQ